ncbi:MAG: NfeD family protein [Microbacteriaceae bacterium]
MGADILSWAWLVWIALVLLFGVIEIFTLDLTFLMLALGGVGGLLASLFGAPPWLQVIVAAALALALVALVRPPLLRALRSGSDPSPSNVEALLSIEGVTTAAFAEGAGTVKLANGETWSARLVEAARELPLAAGERVRVVAIEGATAIVEPTERTVS